MRLCMPIGTPLEVSIPLQSLSPSIVTDSETFTPPSISGGSAAVFPPVGGTSWFVRPSGGGGTGTSWTNAWNGLGAISWGSVAAGDVVWVAGGTYGSFSPTKTGNSSNRVYVCRARADDTRCTGATGWNAAYDAQVVQSPGNISLESSTNYVTISGRVSASGGAPFDPAGYGWKISRVGQTGGAGIETPNLSTASNNTLEYMEVIGPGEVTYTVDGRGVDFTPFSNATGNTIRHMAIHNWESATYVVGINNTTFEWCDIYDCQAANWQAYHPNGIFTHSCNGLTVRYCKFHTGPNGLGLGEGIFLEQTGSTNNVIIHSCQFYDLTGSYKAIEIAGAGTAWKIFNNTFVNIDINPGIYGTGSVSGDSQYRNNLFYNSAPSSTGFTTSNNITATNTNAFVNYAARNLHIPSTTGAGYGRNAGTSLTTYFTTDPDGNTYGADGTWDAGAYEYTP